MISKNFEFFDNFVDATHVTSLNRDIFVLERFEWFQIWFEKILFDDHEKDDIDEVTLMIVRLELDDDEIIYSIILLIVDIDTKILFQHLVDILRLLVDLRMKRRE